MEACFFERGLASTYPIEILRNARLGIDVNHYISRLVGFKKESFLDAIGGFPNSLKLYIESDLLVFKEFNITPVFVFSGNAIVDQYEFKNAKELSPLEKQRNKAWASYQSYVNQNPHSNLPLQATETFREFFTAFSPEPITKDLIDYFVQHDIEYMVAPYLSWFQLAYLHEQDYIDVIYGPTETLLLPNVEKFILGMEFPAKEFRCVDRKKALHSFNVNQQQLLDIAVSVGCDLQPVTLPIYNGFPAAHLFDIGLEIVNSGGNIYANILSLNDEDITGKFQRGVLALRFLPVLKSNGRIELSNYNEADPSPNTDIHPPSDIHDIIGQRLPHEYYFYESIGLINTKLLESIVYGTYVESPPLAGGSTAQYKRLAKLSINAFKNKEINLLTQNMARYYQVKKIYYLNYADNIDVELENRVIPPIFQQINGLVVRSSEKEFSLSKFISSLQNEDLIGGKVAGVQDESERLQTNYEVIATSFLRFLYLLEFFSFKADKIVPNKWTKALFALKDLDETFQEQLLLLLVFFKLNFFKLTDNFPSTLVGGPKTTDKEALPIILLISRLATFIKVDQKKQAYHGPISRSLLSFRSSIDLLKGNMRELLESILVNSLSNNEVAKLSKTNTDWRKFVVQIPYKNVTPNTIWGIIVQTYLDLYYTSKNLGQAKSTVFEFFGIPTNSITNLNDGFNAGFKFVQEAFKLAKVLNEDQLIDEGVFETFVKANELADEILKL